MGWFVLCWKRCLDFSGRSRRREYWWFVFFNSILHYLLLRIALIGAGGNGETAGVLARMPLYVFQFASLVAGLAVAVRRLHDTGRSGWWLLAGAFPVIGSLYLVFLYCQDSEMGDNRYGPPPKWLA